MPTALQTPIRRDDEAKQVGPKRYRKQILPIGKVPYEGRDLEFSREFLQKAANAFNQKAYDQVAFQLADGENKHNLDPEKTRGEVTALELADDGLYGIFDLSDEGAKLIEGNPKLGVSCRIVQDHPKGPAIQHVLGTLDPRATGMGPWEKLDLAKPDSGMTLIDLTDEKFEVPSGGPNSSDTVSTDAQLSAEETAALRKLLSKDGKREGDGIDKDLDAAIAKILGENAGTPEPVALSKEAQDAIDLAKSTAQDAQAEAKRANETLAKANWKADRAEFARKGVPPTLLDLAEPHLSTASGVLDLSKSDSTASAMRKMLEEAEGTIDMAEHGSASTTTQSDAEAAKKAADEWAKAEAA
jgi:hypothetical protein